ncbi:serine hydrolase domain-containing protein [Streptomyces sp. Act-28]
MTGRHDPDAYAELGSVTKVLTGTVLMSLAEQGVLSLDDPIERWSNAPHGTNITLNHLADHRSGLPRLPPDTGLWNPYKDFTRDRLHQLTGRLDTLVTAPAGEREEYSNFGYAVLGEALVTATGQTYEQLVAEHVLAPLGLPSHAVTASPPADQRLLAANWFGRKVAPWDMTGAILPAGGMWASTRTASLILTGLLLDRKLGEPAPSWRRIGNPPLPLTYHNGGTRRSTIFTGALPDGRWVVVHRLSGDVRTIDRAGVAELHAAHPSDA